MEWWSVTGGTPGPATFAGFQQKTRRQFDTTTRPARRAIKWKEPKPKTGPIYEDGKALDEALVKANDVSLTESIDAVARACKSANSELIISCAGIIHCFGYYPLTPAKAAALLDERRRVNTLEDRSDRDPSRVVQDKIRDACDRNVNHYEIAQEFHLDIELAKKLRSFFRTINDSVNLEPCAYYGARFALTGTTFRCPDCGAACKIIYGRQCFACWSAIQQVANLIKAMP